jgi:T-complex protein 1 subunit eta
LISNINACDAIVEIVKPTLGPRGMDKLIFDGQKTTISNDGATIMKLLDIVHPAAKTLVEIAKSQDSEVSLLFYFFALFPPSFQLLTKR